MKHRQSLRNFNRSKELKEVKKILSFLSKIKNKKAFNVLMNWQQSEDMNWCWDTAEEITLSNDRFESNQ